jgi:hypothetical protein
MHPVDASGVDAVMLALGVDAAFLSSVPLGCLMFHRWVDSMDQDERCEPANRALPGMAQIVLRI